MASAEMEATEAPVLRTRSVRSGRARGALSHVTELLAYTAHYWSRVDRVMLSARNGAMSGLIFGAGVLGLATAIVFIVLLLQGFAGGLGGAGRKSVGRSANSGRRTPAADGRHGSDSFAAVKAKLRRQVEKYETIKRNERHESDEMSIRPPEQLTEAELLDQEIRMAKRAMQRARLAVERRRRRLVDPRLWIQQYRWLQRWSPASANAAGAGSAESAASGGSRAGGCGAGKKAAQSRLLYEPCEPR